MCALIATLIVEEGEILRSSARKETSTILVIIGSGSRMLGIGGIGHVGENGGDAIEGIGCAPYKGTVSLDSVGRYHHVFKKIVPYHEDLDHLWEIIDHYCINHLLGNIDKLIWVNWAVLQILKASRRSSIEKLGGKRCLLRVQQGSSSVAVPLPVYGQDVQPIFQLRSKTSAIFFIVFVVDRCNEMTIPTVTVASLKKYKNIVIGNPVAKVQLVRDELFVTT